MNYNVVQTVILCMFTLSLLGLVVMADFKVKVVSASFMFVSLAWLFAISALRLGKAEGIAIAFFILGVSVVYFFVGFILRRT